jgi:drug/metabolite transporter (DMT)-like permease
MVKAPTLTNWIHLITLGLIWGGTFMFVTLALDGYGPITVATARTTLGALSLLILMRVLNSPWPTRDALPVLIRMGAFSTAFPFMLLSWGLLYVPSSVAGISMAAVPLFILPLAHFFSDERLTLRRTVGVLVGFVGIVVLIGPSALKLGSGIELLGQLACFGAATCYAISSIQTRNCPPVDPITMSAVALLVGSVILLPLMLIFEGVPSWQGVGPSLSVLFLGLIPTAFATYLRVLVIRSAGSVFMTMVNFMVPLWSVFFGAALLSEPLPQSLLASLVLILSGLLISQWGRLKSIVSRA